MSTDVRLSSTFAGQYPRKLSKKSSKVVEAAVATVRKNCSETFETQPLCAASSGAGAAAGTTGATNVMLTGKNAFEYHIKGAGQTIVAPVHSSSGLDVSLDQTDNSGVEITLGTTSRSKCAYTVGTDGPFYMEATFSIADVSGTDDCAVGFRKAEAYQAAIDSYDEMAAINVISGDIKVETILNNGTTTTTDTTQDWADAASKTLRVEVDRSGRCTYKVNGSPVTVSVPFTFDSGEVVVPFMYLLHATDLAGAVTVTAFNSGLI